MRKYDIRYKNTGNINDVPIHVTGGTTIELNIFVIGKFPHFL